MKNKHKILIVDDEKVMIDVLTDLLPEDKYDIDSASTGVEALLKLDNEKYNLLIQDIMLPDINGLDILNTVRDKYKNLPVIMMTAFSSVETAVKAMKMGAREYVTKPFNNDEVLLQVKRALEHQKLKQDYNALLNERDGRLSINNIIGKSQKMVDIFEMIKLAAPSKSTVLIQGDSGTGKELIAGAIHSNSARSQKPFIIVNTSTIPKDLLEATLFGHTKGAFTGAISAKKGLLETAQEGTIFFDEIGNITTEVQAKLLRAIQEKSFIPLGATKTIHVDLRIIAATNLDIRKAMKEGTFREDLYYRLNVINIQVPPLRDRIDDLELLMEHFLEKYCLENEKEALTVTEEAMKALSEYYWPGNVRELENVIERATVLSKSNTLDLDLIPEHILNHKRVYSPSFVFPMSGLSLNEEVVRMKIHLIQEAMRITNGIQKEAAKLLSIKPTTLHEMIRRLNVNQDNQKSDLD